MTTAPQVTKRHDEVAVNSLVVEPAHVANAADLACIERTIERRRERLYEDYELHNNAAGTNPRYEEEEN